MAKVTYKPRSDEDAKEVTAFGKKFEAGKAVEITDKAALAKLEQNPWFTVAGSKESTAAQRAADERDDAPDTEPGPSLAQTPNYPPGVGAKTAPPFVVTPEGEARPPAEGTTEANEQLAEAAEKPRRGGRKARK